MKPAFCPKCGAEMDPGDDLDPICPNKECDYVHNFGAEADATYEHYRDFEAQMDATRELYRQRELRGES